MLTRFISAVVYNQQSLATKSLRLLTTTATKLSDSDHVRSKALEKASHDLKTRKEQRWLDTVASDSEAIVKGEKQHARKLGDDKKDMTDLQTDTIKAIEEKDRKGHLPQFDVGRHDTPESRIGSGVSSVLGTRLIFNIDRIDELTDGESLRTIFWYKGIIDLKPLYTFANQSRYHIINRTKLLIKKTSIGDEGFYTLKIQTKLNTYKQYLYHVILFTQNLSLFITPPSFQRITYHAEQSINFTCSISLYADRTYIEQTRSLFSSTWFMIIYNNDPDHYQLLSSSSISYIYTAYLFNYELNQNDHNQTVSCALIQQDLKQIVILNVTLTDILNIEYKAYLYGNYYFTRSFNSYSSIEINCEEFNGNPKPVYSLIWMLNGENQTLLNKTKYGRYFINNATWRHRGNYTCLAENYLNNHQPVHQSFRLNIWFNEHQSKIQHSTKLLSLKQPFQSNRTKSIILIFLIIIFLFSCIFFILSLYYFCLQTK
ncbi:unnamed protein product [Rotaria sp. Silwood1]|nr:unnamed protein product [Rotaria sp. Silwood1]CAF1004589.1 unnamed protein product [Rotaria sp. Silwood1]CAF3412355.1 unnamed protein product [Rotaria sp. Silwood1]CAF4606406.1 unnamed protein product [Rotaria sp. Silwood1]